MTTIDQGSSAKIDSALNPVSIASGATSTPVWVDTQGCTDCMFVVHAGAGGASFTSATYQVFESATDSGAGTLVTTSPASATMAASTVYMTRIDCNPRLRYLSVKITTVGDALIAGVSAALTPRQTTDATAPGLVEA